MTSNYSSKLHAPLTVSIVLPVYNEAPYITACLRAIADQTIQPLEVIVVDNNSTDETALLARSFPFVRVITESKQGVVHARNTGFDAAKGDIIARLDADTVISSDWVAQITRVLADTNITAVTGAIAYYDLPFRSITERIDLSLRTYAARKMKNEMFLQGTNMAMRRSAWLSVRGEVCNKGGLHEDFDLAIHLQAQGGKIVFCRDMVVAISGRCVNDTISSFWQYALLNPGTYAQHGLRSRRHLYPIVTLAIVGQPFLRGLYRLRNADQLSLPRINPATYVD